MTLLTICQNAADECGVDQPGSVIANPNPTAQKLLRYANKVGNRLMKVFAWQSLTKEQTFTSVSGETQTDILPSDFDRFVPETFWNRSDYVLLSGPVSPVEWQGMKANAYGDVSRPRFRYRGGDVLILPEIGAGKSLAFEYVSKNWCQSSGATGQSAWAADTDTGVIDEELITLGVVFEYLQGDGQPFQVAAAAYEMRFNQLIENDQPSAGIMVAGDIFGGGRHFTGTPPVSGSLF